jgi:hypothetical protein
MGDYVVYHPFGDRLARSAKRMLGLSKSGAGDDFDDGVLAMCMSDPQFRMSINSAVLVDEFQWGRRGHPVYFVSDSRLVQALWRARMDLEPEDLGELPDSFVVAWPKGAEAAGRRLRSCLVNIASPEDRRRTANKFSKRHLDGTGVCLVKSSGELSEGDEKSIHLVYEVEGEGPDRAQYHRSSMPSSFLAECLRSAEAMSSGLGTYGGGMAPGTLPLEPDEWDEHYAHARLVAHLLVYMKACPGAVLPGWPDGFLPKPREMGGRWAKAASPCRVGMPPGFPAAGHGHDSPEPHWRNWCFRRYPVRRDGSRTAGLVFVHGTMVGREVEPHTVV